MPTGRDGFQSKAVQAPNTSDELSEVETGLNAARFSLNFSKASSPKLTLATPTSPLTSHRGIAPG